ncbi:MAG: YbaN family protein [Isosphaerales bacterium]
MGSASRDDKKGVPRRDARRKSDGARDRPQIDIDEKARVIRVCDPRLINTDQRAFCRRLLDEATRQPGVTKAEVDLPSATCRVEFGSAPATSLEMADVFAGCVCKAAEDSPGTGRTPAWQPDDGWLTLTAYPLSGDVSLWATLEAKPGRILVRHHSPAGNHDRLSRVAEDLTQLDEVERCRAIEGRHGLSIDFREANGQADWFMDRAEQSFEDVLAAEARQRGPTKPAVSKTGERAVVVATGPKRLMYLALAGGAFAMTLVGLMVPGIPTVPFLLATSYCLARSSRRLNELLRRSTFFGSIVVEWEQHGRLSRSSKGKLIGLTAAVALVAIVLSALSPFVVIVVLLVSSLGIYKINQLPSLPDEQRAGIENGWLARFALPAP